MRTREEFVLTVGDWFVQAGVHHFRVEEFAPPRHGVPPLKFWPRLIALASVLEYVRREASGPISITSGWRDVTHNRRVGGVSNSQHTQLRAADIVARDKSPSWVFSALDESPYASLIALGGYDTFTHVDVRHFPAVGDGSFPAYRPARWSGPVV